MIELLVFFVSLLIGFFAGDKYRDLNDKYAELKSQLDSEPDTPAVIETSPNIVRKYKHSSDYDSDSSAVITTKSPQQIAKEKDAKLQAELDRKYGR